MIKEVCSQISSIDTHVEMQPLSWHPTDKREGARPTTLEKHAKGQENTKGKKARVGPHRRRTSLYSNTGKGGYVGPFAQRHTTHKQQKTRQGTEKNTKGKKGRVGPHRRRASLYSNTGKGDVWAPSPKDTPHTSNRKHAKGQKKTQRGRREGWAPTEGGPACIPTQAKGMCGPLRPKTHHTQATKTHQRTGKPQRGRRQG